jgi:tetratricopeptide (TPR) repeat protein
MTETVGPQAVVQNVMATGGFAYGVIGGDLHIFGEGKPAYVLENWKPPGPPASPTWLVDMPSRMLNAHYGIVRFTGRERELASLRQWLDSAHRLAARWLHGAGGQGKTRLASQVAGWAQDHGWKVIAATHAATTVIEPLGSQDLRVASGTTLADVGLALRDAAGLLLIVDYADRWPLAHLTWLLSNALLRQGVPTRILFIARTADSLPAVRSVLEKREAPVVGFQLKPLADHADREAMFSAAQDGFAARYDAVDPEAIPPPAALRDPELSLTLGVHMAALVAVDAHVRGARLPDDLAGLTIYLLDREHAHWANLYGEGVRHNDQGPRTFQTGPEAMNQAVFVAALTGPVPPSDGATLLSKLGLGSPEEILRDHAVCYPPQEDRSSVLEPLYPDRLGEDFLALTMPGHDRDDYTPKPWARHTADVLLSRDASDAPPTYVSRAVVFLASAASRWPHVRDHLSPVLTADPELAVDAGSAALTAIAAIPGLDLAVPEKIEPLLPVQRDVNLDVGVAAITQRLTEHRVAHQEAPGPKAALYLQQGTRLFYAGRIEEALAANEHATELFRLAAADEPGYLPLLAGSLTNVANRLDEVGRRAEALERRFESVDKFRTAAAASDVHTSDLADAIGNLANHLGEQGRVQEATELAEEAVAIGRRVLRPLGEELVKAVNEGREPDPQWLLLATLVGRGLASSLINLSNLHSRVGSIGESVELANEALTLYRSLAEINRAAELPDLAATVLNVAARLRELDRVDDALPLALEAVELGRELVTLNPASYRPVLIDALNTLGLIQDEGGDTVEALATLREAESLAAELEASYPAAHRSTHAHALLNLGSQLSTMGLRPEALATTQDAVASYRQLADANWSAHGSDLVSSLINVSNHLMTLGHSDEALSAASEAVQYGRQLDQTVPANRGHLADALDAVARRHIGRHESAEAIAAASEAVTIHRGLAESGLAPRQRALAMALNAQSLAFDDAREYEAAMPRITEAAEILRRIDSDHPTRNLASVVANLGLAQRRVGDDEGALLNSEEATQMFWVLTAADPRRELDLAQALDSFALVRIAATAELDRAEEAAQEAVAILERIEDQTPGTVQGILNTARENLDSVKEMLAIQTITGPLTEFNPFQAVADMYQQAAKAQRRQRRLALLGGYGPAALATSLGVAWLFLDDGKLLPWWVLPPILVALSPRIVPAITWAAVLTIFVGAAGILRDGYGVLGFGGFWAWVTAGVHLALAAITCVGTAVAQRWYGMIVEENRFLSEHDYEVLASRPRAWYRARLIVAALAVVMVILGLTLS